MNQCSVCTHPSHEHRSTDGGPFSCRACVAEGTECGAFQTMLTLTPTEAKDEQKAQWEAFTREQHAKGLCEFSGMRVTECQRTICDCFESREGAIEIERKAGLRP